MKGLVHRLLIYHYPTRHHSGPDHFPVVVVWVVLDFHHHDCLGKRERILVAFLYRVLLARDFPVLAVLVSIVEHDQALPVPLVLKVQGVRESYRLVWVEVYSTSLSCEPSALLVHRRRISARLLDFG